MSASMDSDEETFVTLGSPLEVFEDDEVKKPVSVYDIQAKDTKGRPRFHGAFTGGFSAGFFNTVGSKEGFTPSTFVSSRRSKAESSSRNVEDFMDEEDLGEHGIAPQKFATSSDYTSEEQSRKRKAMAASMTGSSIIPGEPALVDLVIPERLSIGVRLLRKMGWKEGQGIGPRRRKKKKHKNISGRVIGCAMPPSGSEDEESDEECFTDVTFAPKDTNPISLEAKHNLHGLGYRGLDPSAALPSSHINLFDPPPVTTGGRKVRGHKGIRGQAFGVGALEDEDADIYATDHLSNYDMTMDFEEKDSNFGWTAPGNHKNAAQSSLPIGYIGKLLAGFSLSSKPMNQKKIFKAPILPRHYRPVHHFKKPQPEPMTQPIMNQSDSKTQPKLKENLNAVDRGLILGETPIFTSVFDLVSKDDKKKMDAAKQTAPPPDRSRKADADQTSADLSAYQTQNSEMRMDSETKRTTSTAPLYQGHLSFKPFSRDPAKQARYDVYLSHIKQGHRDPFSEVADKHMTEWERDREREEFTKAAKLYKPLAGLMANRFITAKYSDETDKADIPVDEANEKSEQAKAAEMKMFGRLTHEECEWVPDKLLCRRFNVPHPYPGSTTVGVPTVRKEKFSIFNFLNFQGEAQPSESPNTKSTPAPLAIQFDGKSQTAEVSSDKGTGLSMKVKPRNLGKPASIFSVLDDNVITRKQPGTETSQTAAEPSDISLEQTQSSDERPPMDLFKAIFKNSDSEESSSDSEDEAPSQKTEAVADVKEKLSEEVIVGRTDNSNHQDGEPQKSALDGDSPLLLPPVDNAVQQNLSPPAADTVEHRLSPIVVEDDQDSSTTYGPALPPSAVSAGSSIQGTSILSSKLLEMSEHVHRKEKHHHRSRHKTEHKHKHKKEKKTKHKKSKQKKDKKCKKLKRRDGSSSESERDTTPSDTELLDGLKSLSRKKMTADYV